MSQSRHHRRLRAGLVVSEVALALALLMGAGLLARSFLRLCGVDPGFRPDRILSLTIHLSAPKYPDARAQAAYYEQVLERLRDLPGVEAVGANLTLPLTQIGLTYSGIEIEGDPLSGSSEMLACGGVVNADYFRALRIPLRRGRVFTDRDRDGAPPVVIVNESFVRHFFPNQEPLGKRIKIDEWRTIVGVVGDARQDLPVEPRPQLYLSYLQSGTPHMSLAVRTRGDPMKLASAVRSRVMSVDKDQPIYSLMTLEQRLADSLAWRRSILLLLGMLSILALILAGVGIYGVIAYSVSRRTHEIGIRMALGACMVDVLVLVFKSGMRLTLAGVVIGIGGGLALTRVLKSQLYEVEYTDPVTLGGVALLLFVVALLACYLPARRAAKINPMEALRYE